MRVRLTVDGTRHDLEVESGRTLADLLRARGTAFDYRAACPDGTCDVCAVVVDGDTIRSCLMLAVQATGAVVSTPVDPR